MYDFSLPPATGVLPIEGHDLIVPTTTEVYGSPADSPAPTRPPPPSLIAPSTTEVYAMPTDSPTPPKPPK